MQCARYFFLELDKHEFFWSYLKENPQYKISSKIYLVGAELFHVGGQAYRQI